MFIFDPLYFVIVGPAMLLALWAQWKVKSAYRRAAQIANLRGLSGAQAARDILDSYGLRDVNIELTQGTLSDHYDPRHNVLRLSPDVYHGRSLAAVGIAAHEAGHALQDAEKYAPLVLRNGIVPLAATGGQLSMWLIVGGILLMAFAGSPLGYYALWAGIILFSTTVVFQLVNLPVEFNASARAKQILVGDGLVSGDEIREVDKVLSAAAMTYVAATFTAVLTLLYLLMRVGAFSRD